MEIQVIATTWVQVYASDEDMANRIADAAASNLDKQFVDQTVLQINDGDYTCEPIWSKEAEDNAFSGGILTIRQNTSDTCPECGLPASDCSFGGYEVVTFE